MQTDKKPIELSTQLFDVAKSYSNMSRIGNLYGRLLMIKDMQGILLKQEAEIEEQIKKAESNV